jgi:hypothetical protein
MKLNIHVLPTNKRSKLAKVIDHVVEEFRFNSDFYNKIKFTETKQEYLPQHIYITSDEEIKEGDWFYNPKFNEIGINYNPDGCKKIVLTTDQDLINDDVQSIDDEFLKWFVKNPSCEYVEVKTFCCREISKNYCNLTCGKQTYKIIIPQEEPNPFQLPEVLPDDVFFKSLEEPKQDYSGVHLRHCYQGEYEDGCKYGEDDCPAKPLEPKKETLEETVLNSEEHNNLTSEDGSYLSFHIQSELLIKGAEIGAKWQSENSYTIEELKKLFDSYGDNPAAKIIWNDILNLKK